MDDSTKDDLKRVDNCLSQEPFELSILMGHDRQNASVKSRPHQVGENPDSHLYSSFNSEQRAYVVRLNKMLLHSCNGFGSEKLPIPSITDFTRDTLENAFKESRPIVGPRIIRDYFFTFIDSLQENRPEYLYVLSKVFRNGGIIGTHDIFNKTEPDPETNFITKLANLEFLGFTDTFVKKEGAVRISKCPFKSSSLDILESVLKVIIDFIKIHPDYADAFRTTSMHIIDEEMNEYLNKAIFKAERRLGYSRFSREG